MQPMEFPTTKCNFRFILFFTFYYDSHRVNQASQGSQEVQDLKELQDHLVSLVDQEDQVPKATLACQDSKVNLTFDYRAFREDQSWVPILVRSIPYLILMMLSNCTIQYIIVSFEVA